MKGGRSGLWFMVYDSGEEVGLVERGGVGVVGGL